MPRTLNLLAWDVAAFMSFPLALSVASFILHGIGQFLISDIMAVAGIATAGQSFFLACFFDLPIGSTRTRTVPYPPEGAL